VGRIRHLRCDNRAGLGCERQMPLANFAITDIVSRYSGDIEHADS
jgi:hypothetical protein